jgi:hypothetical protein
MLRRTVTRNVTLHSDNSREFIRNFVQSRRAVIRK